MIWIVVDQFIKSVHFIPANERWSSDRLPNAYVKEILRLHNVPLMIVSDRYSRFTSRFWIHISYMFLMLYMAKPSIAAN